MKEIVINKSFGGFDLHHLLIEEYLRIKNIPYRFVTIIREDGIAQFNTLVIPKEHLNNYHDENTFFKRVFLEVKLGSESSINQDDWTLFDSYKIPRDDPVLVKLVKDNLDEINNSGGKYKVSHSHLKIVEIPGDVEWTIENYDGVERVAEAHQTWD